MLHQNINEAVEILKRGGLVGMPTETVYGLAADAKNPVALRKIFSAKQRPIDHPLIVHIADVMQLSQWAKDVSPLAMQLANAFWPGPMTLILTKAEGVLDLITGEQDTIGIRIPRHPVAQALLKKFASGVAAPSANRFGRISPTTAEAVREELADTVDLVLEGGQCEVGVESTIIDVSQGDPIILRPGMISAGDIEAVLHQSLSIKKENIPRVSGSLVSHYAPMTPTELIRHEDLQNLENVNRRCVLLLRTPFVLKNSHIEIVQMPNHPKAYAHEIYDVLRRWDKKMLDKIYIESVPMSDEWSAIRDRLMRAAS